MVYYVVYRASEEFKDRGRIPRRLRALGCRQVRKSFWAVKEGDVGRVWRGLQKNQPVLLKRTREIRKPRFVNVKGAGELGSLVVVAYKVPKEVKREKIKNLLNKAPCIRLCRAVYAFYQEHTRFDRNRELVDARRFWRFIREIDEDAKVIPRVVVANSDSVERLLEQAKKRVEKEIENIVRGYKSLHQKVNTGEIDKQYVYSVLPKLKRRFVTVKKISAFYEKWLKIDLSKSLIKPYPAIRKLRSSIDEKYGLS